MYFDSYFERFIRYMFLVGAFCETKNAQLLDSFILQTTVITLKSPLFTEFL